MSMINKIDFDMLFYRDGSRLLGHSAYDFTLQLKKRSFLKKNVYFILFYFILKTVYPFILFNHF